MPQNPWQFCHVRGKVITSIYTRNKRMPRPWQIRSITFFLVSRRPGLFSERENSGSAPKIFQVHVFKRHRWISFSFHFSTFSLSFLYLFFFIYILWSSSKTITRNNIQSFDRIITCHLVWLTLAAVRLTRLTFGSDE